MELLGREGAGETRSMGEPTALHPVDRASWVDPEPTAALRSPRAHPTSAPSSARSVEPSSTGVLLGLAVLAGLLAFVLGGLIAVGADDATPPEPLRTQPIEAPVVPSTVVTAPPTAPPVEVGESRPGDERRSDRERDREDREHDEDRDGRARGRDG